MTTLKTKAGYGIFEAYLERSLTWVRARDSTLTPIDYRAGRNVPSWSWMTYEGRISYLEAPFDKVAWTKDCLSPFMSDIDQTFWDANGNYPTPTLISKSARRFSPTSVNILDQRTITLDQPSPDHQVDAMRCIILGKDKVDGPNYATQNYVLVVAPSSSLSRGGYVRVGVGAVQDHDIRWDLEEEVIVH